MNGMAIATNCGITKEQLEKKGCGTGALTSLLQAKPIVCYNVQEHSQAQDGSLVQISAFKLL